MGEYESERFVWATCNWAILVLVFRQSILKIALARSMKLAARNQPK